MLRWQKSQPAHPTVQTWLKYVTILTHLVFVTTPTHFLRHGNWYRHQWGNLHRWHMVELGFEPKKRDLQTILLTVLLYCLSCSHGHIWWVRKFAYMVLQASNLSGRIYSKEMILAISEERSCVVSVVEKKKPRTFFETIWNQKAGEWSTTRKWPLKITPPMGNFYQIVFLLSAATIRLSSSNVRGSWEWAHSQREKGSHREEVLQSPRFGVSRQGICGCFFFNPVPKSLSRSPRERQR